jgi:hypothetical protein
MDGTEEILFDLFRRLREYLVRDHGVGLTLKAEGQDFTLRVRSRTNSNDEKQPYFALVLAPRDGGYRISYKPGGAPTGESKVTLVDGGTSDLLFDLVRGYVETERKRLMDYRQG